MLDFVCFEQNNLAVSILALPSSSIFILRIIFGTVSILSTVHNLCLHFLFCSTAARLIPTRQAPVPQPQSGAFSGGMGGVGGGGGSGGGGGVGLSSRTGFLRRSNNSKTSKAPPASSNAASYQQQNANFANYQNCTIVRSHAPHANYGYVKLAPKILIFPIFVQVHHFLCACTS